MTKILLTESQFKKIVKVIREQEESVFKLIDVDGEVVEVGDGSLYFDLYLMGEDNQGQEVNKKLELVIDFTIEDSESTTYDDPGNGGGYDWEIVSAKQIEPEMKVLNLEQIKSLYDSSAVITFIGKQVDKTMEEYEDQDDDDDSEYEQYNDK